MSTLTGVIKAATRLGISKTPAESDLWVDADSLYLTSTLYAVFTEDAITGGEATSHIRYVPRYYPEEAVISGEAVIFGGQLNSTITYGYMEYEEAVIGGAAWIGEGGQLNSSITYGFQTHEESTIGGSAELVSAELNKVIGYLEYDTEEAVTGSTAWIHAGTLNEV